MDWIVAVAGIGGFVTGGISLAVTLREKRRTLKVVLRWGVDPTYRKTSGIVVWIVIANAGYQPVVLNGVRLRVQGIPGELSVTKPFTNKQVPLNLQPGNTFATSISSEVLLEMARTSGRHGKTPVRAVVDTVFKEFKSRRVMLDESRLQELVSSVKGNAQYDDFKKFAGTMGSISMNSFDDLAKYVRGIVQQGFDVRTIPELAGEDQADDDIVDLP